MQFWTLGIRYGVRDTLSAPKLTLLALKGETALIDRKEERVDL